MSSTKTVRIYNKTRGALVHGDHKALGNSFSEVPEDIARLWIAQYPDRISSAEDFAKESNPLGTKVETLEAQTKAQEEEIADLKKRLAALQEAKDSGRKLAKKPATTDEAV